MSRYNTSGQQFDTKTGNTFFIYLAEFKYVATILTDGNCMHVESKRCLNSGKDFLLVDRSFF
jgi:hypothetical protein